MQKLTRTPLPTEIEDSIKNFKNLLTALNGVEYKDLPTNLKNSYREIGIKPHLVTESSGKCIYCESKVGFIYPGDIEHIVPKSKDPQKLLDHENLGFCCYKCNHSKSDYHSESLPIINPYLIEPSEHIYACGPLLFAKPYSDIGTITIEKLSLNRAELEERRRDRIILLLPLLKTYCRETRPELRELYKGQIDQEISSVKEYSFVLSKFVNETLAECV
jgi:HNH endonuclease